MAFSSEVFYILSYQTNDISYVLSLPRLLKSAKINDEASFQTLSRSTSIFNS